MGNKPPLPSCMARFQNNRASFQEDLCGDLNVLGSMCIE